MMFQHNISLKLYNSFGVEAIGKYFTTFPDLETLQLAVNEIKVEQKTPKNLMILGGGSNVLFTGNFEGYILKNEIKGIETVHEDEEYVYVKAGAGENWHGFVMDCIQHNFGGVENLSLIPGNVGATPMQNIGAYGVEIKDIFHSLEAFHLQEKKIYTFTLNDCEFDYRQSIFKTRYRHEFVILNVTFRLNKYPVFDISYGAIREELEKMEFGTLSIAAISQAVIKIRLSKLPDPATTGNAGSFFKNPEVPATEFADLKIRYHDIPGYDLENGNVKIAGGWLIEQCGWKGYRKGDAGCYSQQALVLVNYGNASGKEIFELSEKIKKSVKKKFGIELEREVNII